MSLPSGGCPGGEAAVPVAGRNTAHRRLEIASLRTARITALRQEPMMSLPPGGCPGGEAAVPVVGPLARAGRRPVRVARRAAAGGHGMGFRATTRCDSVRVRGVGMAGALSGWLGWRLRWARDAISRKEPMNRETDRQAGGDLRSSRVARLPVVPSDVAGRGMHWRPPTRVVRPPTLCAVRRAGRPDGGRGQDRTTRPPAVAGIERDARPPTLYTVRRTCRAGWAVGPGQATRQAAAAGRGTRNANFVQGPYERGCGAERSESWVGCIHASTPPCFDAAMLRRRSPLCSPGMGWGQTSGGGARAAKGERVGSAAGY